MPLPQNTSAIARMPNEAITGRSRTMLDTHFGNADTRRQHQKYQSDDAYPYHHYLPFKKIFHGLGVGPGIFFPPASAMLVPTPFP